MHFTLSTRSYNNNKEVLKELQKFLPSYEKSSATTYIDTKDFIDTAIINSKKLSQAAEDANKKPLCIAYQPNTDIYKVVGMLQDSFYKLN